MRPVCSAVTLAVASLIAVTPHPTGTIVSAAAPLPRAALVTAPLIALPGAVDSNSPVMWDLEDGQRRMFVLTSHSGVPSRSLGTRSIASAVPRKSRCCRIPDTACGSKRSSRMMSRVYGYYHNEWPASRCGREDRAVPRIGAAKSGQRPYLDRSRPGHPGLPERHVVRVAQSLCDRRRRRRQRDARPVEDVSLLFLQPIPSGPAVAGRRDRAIAVGGSRSTRRARRVVARRDLGARSRAAHVLAGIARSRTLASRVGISRSDAARRADPRVARRRRQGRCVLGTIGPLEHRDRAICDAAQSRERRDLRAGRHLRLYAPRLDDPSLWTTPQKLLNGGRWYPQVVGLSPGTGTDKLAGSAPRFFMSGRSEWVINFTK